MNDPLKKFVNQHRESFDQLEPSEEVLLRLRAQLNRAATEPEVTQPLLQRYRRAAWLAAASLLIGLVCAYLFVDRGALVQEGHPRLVQQPVEKPRAESVATKEATSVVQEDETPTSAPVDALPQIVTPKTPVLQAPKQAPLATRLADSTSASTRLAAILEIEQSQRMDAQYMAMLSETMNHDGNTNVRLAALDVLSRHLNNPQVVDLLAGALTSQDDPLVQLGIVRIASQIDHVGIEEALFAVARSPYTFEAVKDEAYAVLLYQDKL